MLLQSAEPTLGSTPDGRPALNPGVLINAPFVKWQSLYQKPWALEYDPVYAVDNSHLMSDDGLPTRPFENKLKVGMAVEMTDIYGKQSWGIITANSDANNAIEITLYSSRREAYFTAREQSIARIRAALAAFAVV